MNAGRALIALVAWIGTVEAAIVPVTTVTDPWVQPLARRGSTRAFLMLASSTDAALIGARSPLAEVALMQGARRVREIAVRAGEPVAMSAGGVHLQLRGVARALALGERVPLTLVLRDADGRVQEIPVSAEVRRRSAIEDERRAHGKGPPMHGRGSHVH